MEMIDCRFHCQPPSLWRMCLARISCRLIERAVENLDRITMTTLVSRIPQSVDTNGLPLPANLRQNVASCAALLAKNVKEVLCHILSLPRLGFDELEGFILTDLPLTAFGTMDEVELSRRVIKSVPWSVEGKFLLACLFCLDDEIPRLWSLLPDGSRRCFLGFQFPMSASKRIVLHWAREMRNTPSNSDQHQLILSSYSNAVALRWFWWDNPDVGVIDEILRHYISYLTNATENQVSTALFVAAKLFNSSNYTGQLLEKDKLWYCLLTVKFLQSEEVVSLLGSVLRFSWTTKRDCVLQLRDNLSLRFLIERRFTDDTTFIDEQYQTTMNVFASIWND